MEKNLIDEFQNLKCRIDELESMMKLLLANALIDEIEVAKIIPVNQSVVDLLKHEGLELGQQGELNGIKFYYVNISANDKIPVKDIMRLHDELLAVSEKMIPVFMYEKINGMQKKRLLQEKVSFCVKGKETYIIGAERIGT